MKGHEELKKKESERQNLIIFTQPYLEKGSFPRGHHGPPFDTTGQEAVDIASMLAEQLFEF